MFMIAMVAATNMSLSAILFRPDLAITADMIWPDKAACDVVREAHLSKHPAPDHTGLVCLRVLDHIAKKYALKTPSVIEI
jgi:hypothetical protein